MEEWNKKNEFNSFNSWKGLLYSEHYKAIIDWRDGKRYAPLPPIEASLDPIHACNLRCSHCNAASYLISDLKDRRMEDEHLHKLVNFLGEWGVKAICYGGGGEPTLHSALPEMLYLTTAKGMQSSIATNGTKIAGNTPLLHAMADNCRWVGISVDAATPETYSIGRKKNAFAETIAGIKALAEEVKIRKTKCEVGFKFLIFDYNQHEIYDACKLAKSLGAKDFHARPADFSHQGMGDLKQAKNPYDLKEVYKQFDRCRELEDDDFRVFTVVHKFNSDFTPKKGFKQCYAAPIALQLCADGNCYFCVDQRHQDKYKLGSHEPPENILRWWGGKNHKDLAFGNTPSQCYTRCTFGKYCEQCEALFSDSSDPMCVNFT